MFGNGKGRFRNLMNILWNPWLPQAGASCKCVVLNDFNSISQKHFFKDLQPLNIPLEIFFRFGGR